MLSRLAPLALASLTTFLTPYRCLANDSAMGGYGGNLVPLQETRVAMVSEDIELRYDESSWHVRAHYVFRNETDAKVKLQMGFPETHCDSDGEGIDCVMVDGEQFRNMRTTVRGKPVARKKGAVSREHDWAPALGIVWLYDVTFAPREELVIDHSYTTPSGHDVMGNSFTTYVTRTGALWSRPIERATFRVILPARTQAVVDPDSVPRIARARDAEGRLVTTYEARDWTPKDDVFVSFTPRFDWYSLEPAGPLKDLRCGALFSLYMVAEVEDGRPALDTLDLPESPAALRICRNGVYALHGRQFKDEALNQYFYGPEGFVPQGEPLLALEPNPNYSAALLTHEDHKVLALLKEHEASLRPAAVEAAAGDSPAQMSGAQAADEAAPFAAPATEAVSVSGPKALATAPDEADEGTEHVAAAARPGCGGCTVYDAGGPTNLVAFWALAWLLLRRRGDPWQAESRE